MLDQNINATLILAAVNSKFAIQLDLISCMMTLLVTLICVALRSSSDPIMLSLLLTYSLNIQNNIQNLLRWMMYLENQMVAVVRCLKLKDVIQERQADSLDFLKGRPHWPEQGKVEFKGICLRYRPDTEQVLHDLTVEMQPQDKIGIVGRTGAGKSTITLAISRIVEIFSG